jgi:ubiquinone/menaquinone biosynthesis C-methylase UbiE
MLLLVPGAVLLAGILYISENLRKVDISKGFDRAAWQLPQRTIESLRIQAGDQIADIGAGEGYFVFRLADEVGDSGKVYAVEIDGNLVTRLQKKAKQKGYPNVTAVRARVEDPLLPDGEIDLVFFCDAYHHIENREMYLVGLKKDLKPQGRVAVVDWKAIPIAKLFVPSGHWINVDSVLAEMNSAGFILEKSHDFLPFHHFLVFRVNNNIDKIPSSG